MTGKERREQLLGIGRRLFAERGFEGTSIEEIAAQAGVSKPVVYEHFNNKEGLYAVVVDREVERLLAMATAILSGANTREKFEAAAVALLRYIEDNSDGFRILVRDSPSPGAGTFGNEDFEVRDKSRNVAWLAILSFGESWHNLHHCDPTCARHGALKGQIDISARVIRWAELLGWAWDVRWPDERRLTGKLTGLREVSLGSMTRADVTKPGDRTAA